MPRTAGMLSFPDFRGFTRKLVVWNVAVFFVFLILGIASAPSARSLLQYTALTPPFFLHGYVWQILTYSFVHQGILGTALELLSLWFLGSFLESNNGPRWLAEIYFVSVLGAGLAAILLYLVLPVDAVGAISLYGCYGGIFGLLIAFGVLYGDMQFMMFPLPMMIKAKYLTAFYLLLALAFLFSAERAFAFSQLGGALFGYLYIKLAPRRGFAVASSERYFGLRNNYYRWKRRRAAKKFEVYMRKQNREVHFDHEGRYVDPEKDPNDRKWMN
jgi:membrane associated rhomboid family serine protease